MTALCPSRSLDSPAYFRAAMGTTFSGSAVDAPQFMRLAMAALCSLRRWPYVRATKTPPSLWPSQLAMTLKSIPASMALEQKKCRQVWCPYCGSPQLLAGALDGFLGGVYRDNSLVRFQRRRRRACSSRKKFSIAGKSGTVRGSWFLDRVTVNTFNSKSTSRQNIGGLEYLASPTISPLRQPE